MIRKLLITTIVSVNLFANNSVVDKSTNLMWQDASKIVKKNHSSALKYCKNLVLDGYADWRLPNIDELMSITDKNKSYLAIKDIFKHTKNDWYWTSSYYHRDSSRAWTVGFDYGDDSNDGILNNFYVRCVR